jgi:hypothetical protein
MDEKVIYLRNREKYGTVPQDQTHHARQSEGNTNAKLHTYIKGNGQTLTKHRQGIFSQE